MRTEISQGKFIPTKISMSQQTAYQATKNHRRNVYHDKENPVATEIAKESKKSCHDRENYVAIE